jgi:thioredoxin 1
MKKIIFLTIVLQAILISYSCKGNTPDDTKNSSEKSVTVKHLTNDAFKKMVFDYETNKEWKYEGTKPAIVDFYADWCAPCRQLSPIIEELAREYDGKLVVYKVDTVKEKVLAQSLGISGLPTLLFIPLNGNPQVSMGALPKETLVKILNEVLLIK